MRSTVTSNNNDATDRWEPSDTLVLSTQYHPAICPEHPAFAKLPIEAQQRVSALHHQYNRWSHKLYFKHGLSNRLIAALNGYHFADKVASCMMKKNPHAKNQLGRCNQDWFCEFCAYLRGQDMLKKYAHAWSKGQWFEMVLSLSVGVCPFDPEHDFVADVLDAMEAIVKRLQFEKLMDGYVAWIEIKVHEFYPNLVITPHIHIIMCCESQPDMRAMNMLVADQWLQRRLAAIPDILIVPVKSEAHFHDLLKYIKPIDLVGPYKRGFSAAKADGRLDVFHQEVREFFITLRRETSFWQKKFIQRIRAAKLFLVTRRRFFYGGTCHGSSGQPLGLKASIRRTKQHQSVVRAKVEIAREVEYAERIIADRESERTNSEK